MWKGKSEKVRVHKKWGILGIRKCLEQVEVNMIEELRFFNSGRKKKNYDKICNKCIKYCVFKYFI